MKSGEFARTVFETAHFAVISLDLDGNVTCLNRFGGEILGWSPEEAVGKSWLEHFVPPESRSSYQDVFERIREGRGANAAESEVLRRDGTRLRLAWTFCPLHDDSGKVIGVAGIGIVMSFAGTLRSGEDISERKHSEEIIKEKETRIRAALDNMVDGFITIDEQGIVESFNRAAERIFGYTADEVIGRNVRMLMPVPYRNEHDSYIRNYLETGRAKIIGIGRDVEGQRKDGTIFPLSLAVSEMRLGDRRMFAGNLRDLTEERRLREQLYQTEKFSAIGELAAGIAHEIGGPLSVISGNAEFLKENLGSEDPRRDDVEGIVRECDAVAGLIRRLLDFSKPAKLEAKPVDVNESLRNVLRLVGKQIAKGKIELKLDLQVALPPVLGDSNQLEQVFMNLILNARHAMPQGGQLKIRSFASRTGRRDSPLTVGVEVADNGIGIPPANLTRIFDPFFTTRAPGEGTGLGLAITRRIVADHGGAISVQSREGKGTTFLLELPAVEKGSE